MITSEIQKFNPSAVIELFILDATSLGLGKLHFHSGINENLLNVVWQGVEYSRFPIEASGFQVTGQGSLPRPKIRVSNTLGSISVLLFQYGDLIGSTFTRKRTHLRFLDAVNFENGNADADPESEYPDDVYIVDRKVTENSDFVEFELASNMDLAGVQIPRRQIIQNLCSWKYRGSECGYTGENFYNSDDSDAASLSEDVCGKRISSCKKRFGKNGELPFGGFPGAGLTRA